MTLAPLTGRPLQLMVPYVTSTTPSFLLTGCFGVCGFFFFFFKTFSLITVYISQRDTILECRKSESLKQNRIKYGTVLPPSLVFRRAKQNHSISVAAKGFQCDLKSGILEIGQFERCRSSGLWIL